MAYFASSDHRFRAGIGSQGVELALQKDAGLKVLTLTADNYLSDACFIEMPLAIARALRDWLNTQDLAE